MWCKTSFYFISGWRFSEKLILLCKYFTQCNYYSLVLGLPLYHSSSQTHFFFYLTGQIINILDLAGHMVPVTTTQLCCCREKGLIERHNVNECGFVPIKLCLYKQMACQFWPRGQTLLTPAVANNYILRHILCFKLSTQFFSPAQTWQGPLTISDMTEFWIRLLCFSVMHPYIC